MKSKHSLITILIIICGLSSNSQNPYLQYLGATNNRVVARGQFRVDSILFLPVRLDTIGLTGSSDILGGVIYVPQYSGIFQRDTTPGGHKWNKIASTGAGTANDGLSTSSGFIKLGQSIGQLGNPAALTRNAEIPMSDSFFYWKNGVFNILNEHRPDGSNSGFRVRSNTPGSFMVTAEFSSNYVTEMRIKSDSAKGFAGIGYYVNNTHYMGIGTDHNADHNYIQMHNGFPLWIENNSSSVMAAFEDDGDCSIAVNGTDREFGIGVTVPRYKVDINNPLTGQTASNRLVNADDSGSTYITTSGVLTNDVGRFTGRATRSSGSNNLINVALHANAFGGQINRAMQIDSGSFLMGQSSDELSWAKIAKLDTANNASVTPKRVELTVSKSILYSDTLAGQESSGAALDVLSQFFIKNTLTIPDQGEAGLKGGLFLFRNSAYVGAHIYQGAILPQNGVTTMPSAIVAKLNLSQSQTGGHTLQALGWWAGVSSTINMSTGNRISNFAWFNAGAGQNGGIIDTGYGVYINPLLANVGVRYAVLQVGTTDSSVFYGPSKFFNFQADRTITAGGTTGAQTINKISGTVNFAAAATTLVVTNSLVTTSSLIFCTVRTADATAVIKNVVAGSGSFTITLTAAATAETSVGFFIGN